jgi:hypothetical protein
MFLRVTDTDGTERLVNLMQIQDISEATIEVDTDDGDSKEVQGVVITLPQDSFTVALPLSAIDQQIQSLVFR